MRVFGGVFCAAAISAATLVGADFAPVDAAAFAKVIGPDAKVEKLGGGMQFTEGSTWVKKLNALVFSDVPGNELKIWTEKEGLKTFRSPSNNANGNTVDESGRLVTCEHISRSLTRTEKDGTQKTLAASYHGKKLNSPNDVAVKSDGAIYFTDPDYGTPKGGKEQDKNYVFRLDPKSGELKAVIDDCEKPNGLCFSPDESKLYVADSGAPKHIRVFDVHADGTLGNPKVFCKIDKGAPDGIRCDADGRVWSSSGDGAQIFSPDGTLIGRILLPESAANLCFGGSDGKTLFFTARKSLYAVKTLVTGAGLK
jgi:gluconolactonase